MKKRSIFIIFVALSIVCVLGIVIHSNIKNRSYSDVTNDTGTAKEETYKVEVRSRVFYGSLNNSYQSKGTVNADEYNYVKQYELTIAKNDTVENLIDIGQEVKAGDNLMSINGKKNIVDEEGLVQEVLVYDDRIVIEVIQYDKLYIDLQVPYDIYQMLTYDAKVQLLDEGNELEGKLINIGYKLEGGYVNSKIGFDGYILPGKSVDVVIEAGKTKEMLFVPADMVYCINDVYYCYVVSKDNKVEKRDISVGNEYTVIQDGYGFRYMEILSGLSQDEQIAIVSKEG